MYSENPWKRKRFTHTQAARKRVSGRLITRMRWFADEAIFEQGLSMVLLFRDRVDVRNEFHAAHERLQSTGNSQALLLLVRLNNATHCALRCAESAVEHVAEPLPDSLKKIWTRSRAAFTCAAFKGISSTTQKTVNFLDSQISDLESEKERHTLVTV